MVDTPNFGIFHRINGRSTGAAMPTLNADPISSQLASETEIAPATHRSNLNLTTRRTRSARHTGMRGRTFKADQLGLVDPATVQITGSFLGCAAIALPQDGSGCYRPNHREVQIHQVGYEEISGADSRMGIVAGTRILTARGEVEVEALGVGDSVLGLRGPALLPIDWIGRRKIVMMPVEVDAGALGPGKPHRSILMTPEHVVHIASVATAAETLVNGTTIRLLQSQALELYDIYLGEPEILFAEGLPVACANRLGLVNQ